MLYYRHTQECCLLKVFDQKFVLYCPACKLSRIEKSQASLCIYSDRSWHSTLLYVIYSSWHGQNGCGVKAMDTEPDGPIQYSPNSDGI